MAFRTELSRAGKRTKTLVWVYVISGLIGLLMTLWVVLVLLISVIAGRAAVQSLSLAFVFPWLPIVAATMIAAKMAMMWSYKREDREGRDASP